MKGIHSEILYEILRKEELAEWKSVVAEKLRIPDHMQTEGDIRRHLASIKEDLKSGIAKQNNKLVIEKANVAGTTVGVVSAGIGLASDPFSAAQILGAIGSSVGCATAWLSLSKLFKAESQETPTIYQGFRQIKHAYEKQDYAN